jgi:hypothetical protein
LEAPSPERVTGRPYRLAARNVGKDVLLLSLQGKRTGRVLWSRNVRGERSNDFPNNARWATDGRAFGLEVPDGSSFQDALLFWRVGYRVWQWSLEDAAREHNVVFDGYMEDFVWSEDRKRVLFRTWASGGLDLNTGELWCADLEHRRLSFVADEAVRRMTWADDRTVLFWTADFPNGFQDFKGVESPCPTVRRVP